jgi:hypothetical protein
MPAYKTRTYDPAQINLIVGQNVVSGFADGTFVKVERNVDQAALQVGADGESTLALSQNRSGRFTFTLQQSSPLNDVFSALSDALENRSGGFQPVMVKDNNGTTLAHAEKAWCVKRASTGFGKDPETREWIFETGNLDLTVGGSNEIG